MSKYYNPKRFKQKPNDVIFTPLKLAKLMIDFCDIQPSEKVLDPSKGKGVFFNNLPKCNKDWCEITLNRDFFKYNKPVDLIIGNSPYSIWNDWIKHTIKLNPKRFCYIFSTYNLTPKRLSVIFNAGYIITKFHLCKVDWWFSPSFIVLFEKGKKEDSIISFTPKAFFCDICGKGGNGKKKCGRGRTRIIDNVKIKYGMNECSEK
tara:strand:+ start:555 stop:1166 length:612 start_codon:yes stop_codon:yes gene_type:complete